MSRLEAVEQFHAALKAGQKYYRDALNRSIYPYPLVLDEILDMRTLAGQAELGVINIPTELIVGTKTSGRVAALAGNFMPILDETSEFGLKWISLCEAHLSEEGIRDPIRCYEYLGKFYVLEGNKRASVLMSYGAPTIVGTVTRLIPSYSDDKEIRLYYEFMHFYSLAGLYGISFRTPGAYSQLLAALGMEDGHVWTDRERKSFSAGFTHFREAFNRLNTDNIPVSAAEALLVWLEVFPFSEIKELTLPDLVKKLTPLWPDIRAIEEKPALEVSSRAEGKEQGVLSRILSFTRPDHIQIAFIYAFSPETSTWTSAHDHGRIYLEEALGSRVTVKVYHAYVRNYSDVLEQAVADGAKVIFATTPPMIDACRRIAALHKDVKVLLCALARPYTGVRMYYSRIYECKFITGAIAGAMTENDVVGYISNYPIIGDPANVNAFALGVRMTNPRATVKLRWTCLPGDPLQSLLQEGVSVISNRDAASPHERYRALEWGTYKLGKGGEMIPLALPCWDWGPFYEKVILSIFDGTWSALSGDRSVNYWWGLSSGVVSIQLSELLPPGVYSMAKMLLEGIRSDNIHPFRTRITDQNGTLRNDGSIDFSSAALMDMDWLCDNVEGRIPSFDELIPESKNTVRLYGLHREEISPAIEEVQL